MPTKSDIREWVVSRKYPARLTKGTRAELTVFNAHFTPESHRRDFEDTLDWVSEDYRWLSAHDLPDFFQRPRAAAKGKPYAALTFDDGWKSNVWSAQLLAERGIQAAYFIATGFVEADDAWAFVTNNIRKRKDEPVGYTRADLEAMSVDDVKSLAKLGHVVGSHTVNHRLVQELPEAELRDELTRSRDLLEEWLGQRPQFFASPFTTQGLSKQAALTVMDYYDHHFTTLDLPNSKFGGHFVHRTNLEFWWTSGRRRFAVDVRVPERLRWRIKARDFVAMSRRLEG